MKVSKLRPLSAAAALVACLLASAVARGQMGEGTADAPPAPLPERLPAPSRDMATIGPPSGLTLDAVRQMALNHNPSLARSAARIRAARWNALQQGLPPNPYVSYQGNEIGLEGTAGQQGGGVSQQFVTGGKLQLAREEANRQVLVEQQNFATQRQRVLTDVSISFYQVLILQRRIDLLDSLVNTTQRAVDATERLFAAAETRKTDLLQARVELKRAQLDRIRARTQLDASWRTLASVIGLPDLPRQPVRGETDPQGQPISWEQAARTVLAGHPQISQAMAEANRATWTVQRARAEWIPDVTASVAMQRDDGARDDFVSVQISLPLPIWNRNQGGIGDAQAQLTAARRNVQVVELRLRQNLADEYQRYDAAFAWARQYKDHILPLTQETLQLVSRGYGQGEVPYLDLLTAQRTYVQSNLDYLDALNELWSSIQRIEGLLLEQSLDNS